MFKSHSASKINASFFDSDYPLVLSSPLQNMKSQQSQSKKYRGKIQMEQK